MSERIYRDPVHNIIRLQTDTDEGDLMMRLIDAQSIRHSVGGAFALLSEQNDSGRRGVIAARRRARCETTLRIARRS